MPVIVPPLVTRDDLIALPEANCAHSEARGRSARPTDSTSYPRSGSYLKPDYGCIEPNRRSVSSQVTEVMSQASFSGMGQRIAINESTTTSPSAAA